MKTTTVRWNNETVSAYADTDGTVYTYDDVAGHYTVCHSLTPTQEARVRRLTMANYMTKADARRYVRQHSDDDALDPADVQACFLALYGRPADAQDRREGLWSHCCAAVR